VAPARSAESPEQADLRLRAVGTAQSAGLTAITRRTRRHVIRGGVDAHKRLDLLEPRDAHLYAATHRSRVLVLALMAAYVRSDPSEEPARKRHVRKLEDYVRYKALYRLLRGAAHIPAALSAFARWPPESSGLAVGNPRVLPLHVFDNATTWVDLDGDDGLSRFVAKHGSDGRRVDSSGRPWTAASVGHGRDSLVVSGYALPRGFHWDVQTGTRPDRLTTCHEVWKLGARSYANVYPDAFVRVTPGRGRRVWPAA
jgi:hypothetical protein